MTKDSYGYPTKIPTKITDLYGGDSIPTIEDIPTSDDIVEEIEEYLDVDLATEGQVLTMGADGIVEWDDVASGGSIDYSTEEQDTGTKWIDGKEIYCKTITFNHDPDWPYKTIIPANTINQLIKAEGFHYASSTAKFVLLGTYVSNTQRSWVSQENDKRVVVYFTPKSEGTSTYTSNSWHTTVTVYYTKE